MGPGLENQNEQLKAEIARLENYIEQMALEIRNAIYNRQCEPGYRCKACLHNMQIFERLTNIQKQLN